MRAGKLRHRVSLQAPVETQDPNTGEIIYSWVAVDTLWASIEPLSARDFIAARSEQSQISARIVIRFRENISPKMRIVHIKTGDIYNIEGVLPDAKSGREYLTLPVSTGVSDGS